ncbi:HAD-IA family hydrolase [Pigmentiphaga litoralis]|uniref:Phosphoglycolate phosphatase n=1 Tax=Pigmentiphaga litoralis TaxID=516702 RepID=A0A7Y9IWY1_9BURK|nr:HAD-IA family hydrolase [Pigmentiphaga litoralis]NYE21773.1 phosphoglycolate phosphatase [Pigmentiphaga litoralis]NYE84612.1 phosphoglycolate phosphatase [Pigmentiphaga litoralis]
MNALHPAPVSAARPTYSLVVFDWDGTLMDSTPTIVNAIQASCRDLGLPVPPDAAASWVIGLGLTEALATAIPTLQPEQIPKLLERYRFHYLTKDPELRLFPGIQEMLDALRSKGVKMAVATGKSRLGLERMLETTGLRPYFTATRCADETFSKPHPGMLLELMEEIGTIPEEVIMIGDTSHDLNMACNAGVAGLGVAYGAHPISELLPCRPEVVVHTVPELHAWLIGHVIGGPVTGTPAGAA